MEPGYDWGLRTYKCTIKEAGLLLKADPAANEFQLLRKAISVYVESKLVSLDIEPYQLLLKDFFPDLPPLVTPSHSKLKDSLSTVLQ